MPVVIASSPGQVVALPMANDAPIPMAMTGWAGAGAFKAIITEVAVSPEVNIRATQSMGDLIYVYAFGRKMSQMRVGGFAFSGGCSQDGTSGIEYVQDYFDRYSAASQPAPVTVVLGTSGASVHSGFLIRLDTQIVNSELRLSQFAFTFLTLPKVQG